MTDDIERDEEAALTAEYVLGLLSDDETQAFEDVLAVEPSLREEYAFWADRMVALTDDVPAVSPPPGVLARLKQQLFDDAPQSATDKAAATGRSWLSRLGFLPAVGGGLLAAAVALLVVNIMAVPEPAAPIYTAQIVAEDDSLIVQASYSEATRTLTLTRQQGEAREGRSLELWLIAGDAAPVSLGVLPDDPNATIVVDPSLVPALSGGLLAITDEPEGGSPIDGPTGDLVAAGTVVDA